MSRTHRIIAALYCLLVAYCLTWVPWSIEHKPTPRLSSSTERVGYGWLWSGPKSIDPWAVVSVQPENDPYAHYGGHIETPTPISKHNEYARPDFALIAMRLIVVTCISLAALLLAGPFALPAKNRGTA